jgi:hypothetical protein
LAERTGTVRFGVLQILYAAPKQLLRQFYVPQLYRRSHDMNTTFVCARRIHLALIVAAVVEHRRTPAGLAVCTSNASSLLRLGHGLMLSARHLLPPRSR